MLRCYVSVFRKEQRQVRMIAAGETFHSLLGIQEVYSKQQKTKRKSDASNDWYISSTQDGCDEESNRGGRRRRQLLTAMSRSHLQFQANEREIWSKNDPSYHIQYTYIERVADERTDLDLGRVGSQVQPRNMRKAGNALLPMVCVLRCWLTKLLAATDGDLFLKQESLERKHQQ